MPFRLTIEKYHTPTAEYWVNVYWCDEASLSAAMTVGIAVANAERAIYFNTVIITKVRADDGVENTDQFTTTSLNLAGTRETNDVPNQLPLFVVARVDFNSATGGRPSRKFLRGVLHEAETSLTALSAGLIGILASYGDAVRAANATDHEGNPFISSVVWPAPAMRQLRRGSKRVSTP